MKNYFINFINYLISFTKSTGQISDGNYTFEQLYTERINLFIATSKLILRYDTHKANEAWRSLKYYNGKSSNGYFIFGLSKGDRSRQIVLLLPISLWEDVYFAETLDYAPRFDLLKPEDMLHRIKKLI